MAGIKLGIGGRVVFFGAAPATDSVVVTVSGTSRALPGTDAGSSQGHPHRGVPGQGRATGGVRCHRFLKGEDVLLLAWVGPAPAAAAAASGGRYRCRTLTGAATAQVLRRASRSPPSVPQPAARRPEGPTMTAQDAVRPSAAAFDDLLANNREFARHFDQQGFDGVATPAC